MRPLKITMSAFESYAEKTDIDMSLLGKSGIYLITGSTGAGKTTIFDAITFALYGALSGERRNKNEVRSSYALDKETCYVQMTFEYRGKKYTVYRRPKQQVEKTRKSGEAYMCGVTADAWLCEGENESGKSLASKPEDVTEKIKNLLGIDIKQFRQIAMISQGDFQKLLDVDTKERSKILTDIFNMGNFDVFTQKVKEGYDKAKYEYNDKKTLLAEKLNSFSCSEKNPFGEKLEEYKNAVALPQWSELRELCGECAKWEKESFMAADKSYKKLDKEYVAAASGLEAAQNKQKLISQLEAKKKELETADKQFQNAVKNLEEKKPYEQKVIKLRALVVTHEGQLEEYDNRETVRKDIIRLENVVSVGSEKMKLWTDNGNKAAMQLEGMKKQYSEYKNSGVLYEKAVNSSDKYVVERDSIKKLLDDEKRCVTHYQQLEYLKKVFVKVREDYEKADSQRKQLEILFYDGQAGLLAANLRDGEPCLVCGSVNHPHIAQMQENVPDKKQLDEIKLFAEQKGNEYHKKSSEVKSAMDMLEKEHSEILAETARLLGEVEFREIETVALQKISMLEKKLSELNCEAEKYRKQSEIFQKLEGEIAELEKKIADNSVNISKISESVLKAKTLKDEKTEAVKSYDVKLELGSKAEAQKRVIDEKMQAESLDKELKNATEQCGMLEKKCGECKAAQKQILHQLDDLQALDLEAAQVLYNQLSNKKKELEILRDTENKFAASSEEMNLYIADMSAKAEKCENEFRWISELYSVSSGTITGKDKISLTTYVLFSYFDRIMDMANVRMLKITDGHYEMTRNKNLSRKSESGLEINIIDHYSGTERSIKSMSGGEMFIASLSLALGMSDEIRCSSGGIRLDTMFIDEGFGSLDGGILDTSVNVLNKLSDDNRLIGIISHVEQLSERITRKLEVKKDRTTGSHVSVVI